MFTMRSLVLACVLTLGFPAAVSLQAYDYHARQYYGSWQRHSSYSYRPYYYKPTPSYTGYRHNYVVYKPSYDSHHYYYYNPYKKTYWGRCPTETHGEEQYSMLQEEDRREKLADIPEAKFPKPGKVPNIPQSEDGAKLDLPPDDKPPKISSDEPVDE